MRRLYAEIAQTLFNQIKHAVNIGSLITKQVR